MSSSSGNGPSSRPLHPDRGQPSSSRQPFPPSALSAHFRPDSDASEYSLLPPNHPAAQYAFTMRESKLNGGPGPEVDDFQVDDHSAARASRYSKRSRYSGSVYSDDGNIPAPEALPEMPSRAEMHNSISRSASTGSTSRPFHSKLRAASSLYAVDNPFMDTLHEELPEMTADERSSARSSSASSGQFNLYVPEKHGVVSPINGEAKGIDEIIKELQDAGEGGSDYEDEEDDEYEDYDVEEGPSVVRQASMGRKQRGATITSIRSPKIGSDDTPAMPELDGHHLSALNQGLGQGLGQGLVQGLGQGLDTASSSALPHVAPLSPRSPYGHAQDLASDASKALGSRPDLPSSNSRGQQQYGRARSPLVPMQAFRAENTPPKKGAQGSGGGKLFLMPARKKSIKDRVGSKAPADINVNAVRDAEAHGSITSLPGLITRAFNLRSNLEDGNTSSKHSDWFGNDLLRDLAQRGRSTASLGQVLDGFTFSPTLHQKERSGEFDDKATEKSDTSEFSRRSLAEKFNQQRSSSNQRAGNFPIDDQGKVYSKYDHRNGRPFRPHRKCCGVPLWLFLLLLGAAAVLLTLAIVLPITLVKSTKPPATCATTLPCQNGGLSITAADGSCQCLCINNYTGQTCSSANPSGCGTVQTSTVSNATVGSSLVALFNNAEAQFAVALNTSAVLPVFNSNNLTCDLQNALVVVSSNSKRLAELGLADLIKRAPTPVVDGPAPTITAGPDGRKHARDLQGRQNGAATTNGLLIAGGDSSSTSTATSSAASSTSSSSFNPSDPTVVAFAQTAILYTVQSLNNLGAGIGAQAELQRFFSSPQGQNASSVSLGNGFTANLQEMNIIGNNKNAGLFS